MYIHCYFGIYVNKVANLGLNSKFNYKLQNSFDREIARVDRRLLPIV